MANHAAAHGLRYASPVRHATVEKEFKNEMFTPSESVFNVMYPVIDNRLRKQ